MMPSALRSFSYLTLCSIVACATLAGACSSDPEQAGTPVPDAGTKDAPETADERDILAQLRKIAGIVEAKEEASPFAGTRFFVMRFEQPVDHLDPASAKFTQRVTLLFRSQQAPMVFVTAGYNIGAEGRAPRPFQDEATELLGANQVALEHRFFGESSPEPRDWKKLDIRQAATDDHRLVEAFRPLFAKKWLTTGASKGGMTALYHRYFYPDDAFATLAYVAPNSFGTSDPRYVSFLENVGDAACRDKLKVFQTELLRRRAEVEPKLAAAAATKGDKYERLGIHIGLDYTVTDAAFSFWQLRTKDACANIPPESATTDQLFDFLNFVYFGDAVGAYADSAVDRVAAYYYQAATELGGPACAIEHLRPLLTPGFRCLPDELPPLGVEKSFREDSMREVAAWVNDTAERVLLVYGENDPWSAGAFTVRSENDSHRYIDVGANHLTRIRNLPETQIGEVSAHLGRWMDVTIKPPKPAARRSLQSSDVPNELQPRAGRIPGAL